MKITVETLVQGNRSKVWSAWNNLEDGADGFEFEGAYTCIVPRRLIEYRMSDGRQVQVEFSEHGGEVPVRETLDAEAENTPEVQRAGWQAILERFATHVRRQS